MKPRSIYDNWEITCEKPSPYHPIRYKETKLFPFDSPKEYAKHINRAARGKYPLQGAFKFDEDHIMPGIFTRAVVVGDEVIVTFVPKPLGDGPNPLWIFLNPKEYSAIHAASLENVEWMI